MTTQTDQSTMLNVTGLWLNKSKSGVSYMSGSLGNLRVLIFRNTHKTQDKQPDYQLCFAPSNKDRGREKKDNPEADAGGDHSNIPF